MRKGNKAAKILQPSSTARKRALKTKATVKLRRGMGKRKPIQRHGIKARYKRKRGLRLRRRRGVLMPRRRRGRRFRYLRWLKLRRRRRLLRRRLRMDIPVPPQDPPDPYTAAVPGLNLIGYIRTEIGLGEASRLMAKALEAADLPFGIVNFADPGAALDRNEDMSWAHKELNDNPYKVNLFHLNAPNLRAAYDHPFHPLGRDLFHNRFNIGYWAWELPELPETWCNSFELVNEVWAPSQFVVNAVQQKSPHPVIHIPHAVHVANSKAVDRRAFGLPEGPFLFLAMYDTHSLKERMNPQGAIHAFKRAFSAKNRSVGLVIKVNNPQSNPGDIEWLKQQCADYGNIYLIAEILGRQQVDLLLNSTDCFVSLHRSEGFGLVLAEAMHLGKPVIGTNWSGNTDFMNAGNSCPVNYSLVPVGKDIGPYQAHQLWADPDEDHAAAYMRLLVRDPGWRASIAQNGKHTIHAEYSPAVVGQRVRDRLTELGQL
ncbi:glycosyltransferase family 4 protein [Paenibacillus aestuarii]|uniref:Glycosyltransferase family 4 protein n=1 Tax=Paenibacillus aestuarii TaxID=516965 RepID=A0ABW0K1S7_9BACL|nr:glycosyltransferase [Paenibacillus aestuarii]